jgi:Spy/CpxP family protein refolding chaperone
MENSKIILVTLLVLTLLVGTMGGYLIANSNRGQARQDDMGKLMMLKAMADKRNDGPPHDIKRGPESGPEGKMALTDRGPQDSPRNRAMDRDQMHEKKGEMFLKIMTKKCNLTDKQQTQVKDILESSKDELKVARDEFKGKLDAIKDKTDVEIENILTDEQKAEFKELKENAKKCHMQQSKLKRTALKRYALKKQAINKQRMHSF